MEFCQSGNRRLLSAWDAAEEAFMKSSGTPFVVRDDPEHNAVIFSFAGSIDGHSFLDPSKFGEGKVENNQIFKRLKDCWTDTPASVHQGALAQFSRISNDFLDQAVTALQQQKRIVCTGHSMGGAMAVLATVALLNYGLDNHQSLLDWCICITFGFPLVGDDIFARAVRQHKWDHAFYNVVLWHDVSCRMLLAPCQEVVHTVEKLLPSWRKCLEQENISTTIRMAMGMEMDFSRHHDGDVVMDEGYAFPSMDVGELYTFVNNVLQGCTFVASYTSASNMSPTNPLMSTLKHLFRPSPYRPLGRYAFLSSNTNGGIWLDNEEAVLPLLFYGLQDLDFGVELEEAVVIKAVVFDHVAYGKVLRRLGIGIDMPNMVHMDNLCDLPLSATGETVYDSRVSTQLCSLGIGIENVAARLALRAAGEAKKRQSMNMEAARSSLSTAQGGQAMNMEFVRLFDKMKKSLDEIDYYRGQCLNATGICYYDSFKLQQRKSDFSANLNRVQLAGCFDQIFEMMEKHELPDEFQSMLEFLQLGTRYRLLVEPLDIANFYRLDKNQDSGPYLRCGRPRRYKYFEQWVKASDSYNPDQVFPTQETPLLTNDPCIWADIEDMLWLSRQNDLPKLSEQWQKVQSKMKTLIDSNKLSLKEIMAQNSIFQSWWYGYLNDQQRQESILFTALRQFE